MKELPNFFLAAQRRLQDDVLLFHTHRRLTGLFYLKSGVFASEMESSDGIYGFMSITGVPSKASMLFTLIIFLFIEIIEGINIATGLGLTGDLVANIPVKGLFLLCLGCTFKSCLSEALSRL